MCIRDRRIAATYTTNQYILPPVYKRFLALRLPVSLWIHTLRDVDITQALLSLELDFDFIDSNTVFDDRLTVRPAFREPFLLLSPPDSHYPEEVLSLIHIWSVRCWVRSTTWWRRYTPGRRGTSACW